MKRKRVVSEHYVNNKEFLEALVVFKAKCSAAKEAGEPARRYLITLENVF